MEFAASYIAAFISLVWGAHRTDAGIIYNSDNGHYYLVLPSGSAGSGTWSDAFVAAQTYSYQGVTGHLVTITSQSEQNFVNTIIAPYERGGTLTTTDSFWLGGVRTNFSVAHDALGFAWVTGEAFNYTNWSPNGAPDSTNEFYMEMYNIGPPFYVNETPGVWNDIGNNGQGFLYGNGFIVEFDTFAVPEPASLTLFAIGALGLLSFARQRSANCTLGSYLKASSQRH